MWGAVFHRNPEQQLPLEIEAVSCRIWQSHVFCLVVCVDLVLGSAVAVAGNAEHGSIFAQAEGLLPLTVCTTSM